MQKLNKSERSEVAQLLQEHETLAEARNAFADKSYTANLGVSGEHGAEFIDVSLTREVAERALIAQQEILQAKLHVLGIGIV